MVRAPRSRLLQWQVLNLLSRITGFSQQNPAMIRKGIANQWITNIGVYGVDEKNRCQVLLELEINWEALTSQVLVLGDREAIAETVSTEDDQAPEVGNAVSVFNQTVEAGDLRTEWYYHYDQGLDPRAVDKELGLHFAPPKGVKLPDLKFSLSGFSSAYIPTEFLQALLQHRYALEILTQSLANTHGYLTNPAEDNSHLKAEGLPHVTELRAQADLGSETTHEAEQARAVRRHVEQLREEAKIPQGIIIYQRGNLPENYDRHAKQLVEALGNQQHSLRQPAEQLLWRFAKTVEKTEKKRNVPEKGILIEQASRKFGIPARTLASWVEMDLIPVLSRGKQAIYLDEGIVAVVAPLYHEAKQRGVQPARLLKTRLAQQTEGNPQPSR